MDRSESSPENLSATRMRYGMVGSAILFIGMAMLPVFGPSAIRDFFSVPRESKQPVGILLALTIPALSVAGVYAFVRPRLPGMTTRFVTFLVLLAVWMTDLHYSNVDLARFTERFRDNVAWQRDLHVRVIGLAPDALPHSYRFLPNGLLAHIHKLTGNFLISTLIYRFTFYFLSLCAIYAYARKFVSTGQARVAVLLWLLAYPISIRYYAGQLADPFSHFTFVFALILTERRDAWGLAPTVLMSMLAKETILIMPVFYALRHWPDRRACGQMVGLFAVAVLGAFLLRFYVSDGFSYKQISGVGPAYLLTNLSDLIYWPRQMLGTIGILFPLTILGWKRAAAPVRQAVLFLAPCLILSTMIFSSMREARNYMPLVVPMAVIGAGVVLREIETSPGESARGTNS